VIVVEAADGQFVDDAAQFWAEATAKRDHDPEVAPLALARPVIEAVLGSSRRSRLLVALDSIEQVVGLAASEPSAGDSAVADLRYLGVLPNLWVLEWPPRSLPRSRNRSRPRDSPTPFYRSTLTTTPRSVHTSTRGGFLSETSPPITALHGSNSDTGSALGRPNDRSPNEDPVSAGRS
jgi:hypothetical protein